MQKFALTCEAVRGASKKTEKVRLAAEYFSARPLDEAAQAAVFFSGRAFPAWQEQTLGVGGALLWRTVADIARRGDVVLRAAYRMHGDMGSAAAEVLNAAPEKSALSLSNVAAFFDQLAQTPAAGQKSKLLHDLLSRATALEAKYIIKIIGGDLRIGLR